MTLRRARPLHLLPALALVAAWLVAAPPPAALGADPAATLTAQLNAARRDAGLPALAVRSDLRQVAQRHSGRMADRGELYHSDTGREVSGWQAVGENVGRGSDLQQIHDALMASAPHRANILSSKFTEVGIGVVHRDGSYWVTQTFRRPSGTVASAPPSPKPAPSPSPKPAPKPPPGPKPASAPSTAAAANLPAPPPPAPAEPVVDRLTVTLARIETLDSAEDLPGLLEVDGAMEEGR